MVDKGAPQGSSTAVQDMELDLIAAGKQLPDDTPADLSPWGLKGGCTMPRDQHREHIRMLLGLGQRP